MHSKRSLSPVSEAGPRDRASSPVSPKSQVVAVKIRSLRAYRFASVAGNCQLFGASRGPGVAQASPTD